MIARILLDLNQVILALLPRLIFEKLLLGVLCGVNCGGLLVQKIYGGKLHWLNYMLVGTVGFALRVPCRKSCFID